MCGSPTTPPRTRSWRRCATRSSRNASSASGNACSRPTRKRSLRSSSEDLRASLQSASLITGQQNVALDFVTDAPPAECHDGGQDFVVPATEGGGFAGLTASATELLNKVNTMPFDQIGKNLDGILKSVNDVAQGPQMKKALTELAAMIASAQNMVQNLDSGLSPAASSCRSHRGPAEDIGERQQAGAFARQRLWRQHQVQPGSGSAAGAGQ